jgi:hypothetical protein
MESQTLFICCMLVMNFGSKYVIEDVDRVLNIYFKKTIAKTIILFAMCYVASRKVITAAIFTVAIYTIILMISKFNKNTFWLKYVVKKNMVLNK